MPNCIVSACSQSRAEAVFARSNNGGLFRLGPLMREMFTLKANRFGRFADSEPELVAAGTSSVILRVQAGAYIQGTVSDVLDGENTEVVASRVETNDNTAIITNSNAHGEFMLGGLTAGTYKLCARDSAGRAATGRAVFVPAGARITNLDLKLNPGARLEIRYTGQADMVNFQVRSDGAMVATGSLVKDGASVQIVPAGNVAVESLSAKDGSVRRKRELVLTAGDRRDVVIDDE